MHVLDFNSGPYGDMLLEMERYSWELACAMLVIAQCLNIALLRCLFVLCTLYSSYLVNFADNARKYLYSELVHA